MDASDTLDEFLRVSDEVRTAVVFERGGEPVASNLTEDEARVLASVGDEMLAYAETLRPDTEVQGLQAVTPGGDVYVVREAERAVVAVAEPGSLAGLVQHDLRTLLGSLTRRRRKAVATA